MNAWIMLAQELTDTQKHAAARHDTIVALLILLGVVLVGFLAILLIRRRLLNAQQGTPDEGGFSLSDLRAMRDRGDITPAEYEATRAHVIAKVKAPRKNPPPTPPGTGTDEDASPQNG